MSFGCFQLTYNNLALIITLNLKPNKNKYYIFNINEHELLKTYLIILENFKK